MFKLTQQFKVRVVYKSGYTHDFWATEFTVNAGGRNGAYTWTHVEENNKPLLLGADDISAVYVVGTRKRFMRT